MYSSIATEVVEFLFTDTQKMATFSVKLYAVQKRIPKAELWSWWVIWITPTYDGEAWSW